MFKTEFYCVTAAFVLAQIFIALLLMLGLDVIGTFFLMFIAYGLSPMAFGIYLAMLIRGEIVKEMWR